MIFLLVSEDGSTSQSTRLTDGIKDSWCEGLLEIYTFRSGKFQRYTDVDATGLWTGDFEEVIWDHNQ